MRQGQNAAAVNVLIMRHIARDDVEPHVHASEKRLNFRYLRHLSGRHQKVVKSTRHSFIQGDPERHLDAVAKCRPVHHCADALYHACVLHPRDPPRGLSGCDCTAFRKFSRAERCLGLPYAQNTPVEIIKH